MRGRNVLKDVVGTMSFAEAFYFIVVGKDLPRQQIPVLDACMVILMDHGLTPTAMVARLIADSLPDQPQVAVAAGTMMVGDKFVGSMAGMGALLEHGVNSAGDERAWARDVAKNAVENKRRLPGFGHPYYHPTDPRAERLFEIASEHGARGRHIDLVKALSEELDRASGKRITLNATGALGAILGELQFPAAAMRGLAVVSRSAGLVAHTVEERKSPVTPSLMQFAGEIEYRDPD